ncbi:tRNA 2-selenouridine(34) synthase MnmH [Paenibacillus arenilitoris]|uniref:tRNA 2-selenouridine(34) synthase MnmH n=1 Tax=Paenibacillus arenilitoris TaxID=2772299 RepID=A0A927H5Z0_9BACL|nr:tRNA 2-selenouridine(34) synthase MnmH [Paenibacillus arenilitoris]MBD2868937.1 tRNA 2-selenouridine(34) synthase MnmH [Paenibacillus arenilitoris]
MFQDITVEELLELRRKGEAQLIDVRSPSEYAESTIPGSVNIPLFDDKERAEIGTLYKQESVEAAKERGLEIVSGKLPGFIREIAGSGPPRKVVFCWRGGMRSRTSATLASLMGHKMYRLTGGFRAYRRWVVETLEGIAELPPCYVVNGFTGTGKTELLARLRERGYPVLDLEWMAQHRGSIFGHIGLSPSNQKTFDSRLVHELIRLKDAPYLILEAESKRIGKIVLPEFLMKAKEAGTSLYVEMPIEARVANIVGDYKPAEHKEDFVRSFERIEKRIHTPVAAEIRASLAEDRFEDAARLLLLHYYDPRYQYATEQYEQERITIAAAGVNEALEMIIRGLPKLPADWARDAS